MARMVEMGVCVDCQARFVLEVRDDIIIIFINCNWVITLWPWLYYMYTNLERKKVSRKFKSAGLHERHVVATWKVGYHLSIRL